MGRPFDVHLQVTVPRRGDVDNQQDIPLLNISAPASPTSPPSLPAHLSSTPLHSTEYAHSLVLPINDPLSSTAPQASPPFLLRVLSLSLHLSLLLSILLAAHSLSMSFQRTQLRCHVLSTSHLLSLTSPPLTSSYWWDFGTLLGLRREDDVIYTEVDADLSVTWRARDLLLAHYRSETEKWRALGFVNLEARDGLKLRIYGDWGWYLDVDVWEAMAANATQLPTQPGQDGQLPSEDLRMQMMTGRRETELYNLPSSFILPVASHPAPTAWSHLCRREVGEMARQGGGIPSLSWPAAPTSVLQYWYGDSWMQPRRFDKGKDFSSDRFEVFLWEHLEFLYELLWTLIVGARVGSFAMRFHRVKVVWYGGLLLGFLWLTVRWGRRVQKRLEGNQQGWRGRGLWLVRSTSSLVVGALYLALLFVALFAMEERGGMELGRGMWRGLLPGLAVPLGLFYCLVGAP